MQWWDTLEARKGVSLSPAGMYLVMNYCAAQFLYGSKRFDTVEAWDAAVDRLVECGCFLDSEYAQDDSLVTVQQPVVPEPEEVGPSFDEVLAKNDTSSRRGIAAIRAAAEDDYFGNEAKAVWNEWFTTNLVAKHQFMPSVAQQKACFKYFQKFNLSYLDKSNYDRCRVAMVKSRVFPNILTPEEQAIEKWRQRIRCRCRIQIARSWRTN